MRWGASVPLQGRADGLTKFFDFKGFRLRFSILFASDPLTPQAAEEYPATCRPVPRRGVACRGILHLRLSADPTRSPSGVDIETPETAPESGEVAAPPSRIPMWIATVGPCGYAPVAPGTVASAATIGLYLPFVALGPLLYLFTVVALTAMAIWAADEAERVFQTKDDGRIVIDEVVGQLLTWAPLVILAPPTFSYSPFWLVTGFVVFRVLDIWKPGPVRWAERNFKGGAGVVLDDAMAGVIGGIALGAAMALT